MAKLSNVWRGKGDPAVSPLDFFPSRIGGFLKHLQQKTPEHKASVARRVARKLDQALAAVAGKER